MKLPALIDLLKSYGPHSYGLVTVLILWFAIGQPGLDAQRVITMEWARSAHAFQTATENMARQAESSALIATQLNKTMDRAERLIERLESNPKR